MAKAKSAASVTAKEIKEIYAPMVEGLDFNAAQAKLGEVEDLSADSVNEILAKLFKPEPPSKPTTKAGRETVKEEYEQWRMEFDNGDLKKLKKVKTVKMESHRIEQLNSQASNTRIKYFKV